MKSSNVKRYLKKKKHISKSNKVFERKHFGYDKNNFQMSQINICTLQAFYKIAFLVAKTKNHAESTRKY